MYSTVIRQQHMIDIGQNKKDYYYLSLHKNYYKTKGSNPTQSASRAQNNALEATRSHSAEAEQPSESA